MHAQSCGLASQRTTASGWGLCIKAIMSLYIVSLTLKGESERATKHSLLVKGY